jgi:hypothetical protein
MELERFLAEELNIKVDLVSKKALKPFIRKNFKGSNICMKEILGFFNRYLERNKTYREFFNASYL